MMTTQASFKTALLGIFALSLFAVGCGATTDQMASAGEDDVVVRVFAPLTGVCSDEHFLTADAGPDGGRIFLPKSFDAALEADDGADGGRINVARTMMDLAGPDGGRIFQPVVAAAKETDSGADGGETPASDIKALTECTAYEVEISGFGDTILNVNGETISVTADEDGMFSVTLAVDDPNNLNVSVVNPEEIS